MRKLTITNQEFRRIVNQILNEQDLNDEKLHHNVKHIYQPTGNSCGPTCIKMIASIVDMDSPSIEDICIICGTDWTEGTPPRKMVVGLNNLNLKYVEHISEDDPYQSLRDCIDRGNLAIVRTITQGVPHWIIAYGYRGDVFYINDPWKGQIKYTDNQLEKIWHQRDYFYFEIFINKSK